MKAVTPATIRPPFACYSHAVEVPPGHRLLAVSGQLGVRPDDTVARDAGAQAEQCFANIDAILAEAGMDRTAIVRVSAFVTDRAHMAAYMAARDRYLSGVEPPPASTLMIVSGFTREEFKVEVEVLAAAPAI